MIKRIEWREDYQVQAAVLFGSHARGDADKASDTDLAVFATASTTQELARAKSRLVRSFQPRTIEISMYSSESARRMAETGSLFLWHLRLEGKTLFENGTWLHSLYQALVPYSLERATKDLNTFESILCDIEGSLATSGATVRFEAATTFTILRNLGIIHSFFCGNPCFGRFAPVAHLERSMQGVFPFERTELDFLQRTRVAYSRSPELSVPEMAISSCQNAVAKTRRALEYVRETI
jgi:predicted nucleotidyltransferase